MAKLGGRDFLANAVPAFLLDTAGDFLGSKIPVKGLGNKFVKNLFGEIAKENIQEGYQTAT